MDLKKVIAIVLLAVCSKTLGKDLQDAIAEAEVEDSDGKVLSRAKRFIMFPDGSSFQLVFCNQNMGYLQLAVVWFGNTAALAWELPTDPMLFHYLNNHKKYGYESQRRSDSKHIVYLNEKGQVIATVPYRKKPLINPAFAKRSIEFNSKKVLPIKQMHERHKNGSHYDDWNLSAVEFHRTGRKSLYEKLETFLQGMGWQGKECIFRFLCESANSDKKTQGTFIEEIFKATFTLPRSHESELHEYDEAHGSKDCSKLYPNCVDVYGQSMYSENL